MSAAIIVKLLVFAHKPPPHHGQSYMVEQLLEVCGGDQRVARGSPRSIPRPSTEGSQPIGVECYQVDCRYSDELGEIGHASWRKFFRLIKYCAEALWCRARYGAADFLYIPAPGMRAPLYRDWMVMAICRLFFRRRIFYWHAGGLGEWLVTNARPWERWLSRFLLGHPDLSIVLGEYGRGDAGYFGSRRTVVVPNAIPDPCPKFNLEVCPARQVRANRRVQLAKESMPDSSGDHVEIYRVLFVSLCTREKGLFDALDATALANRELARRRSRMRVQLSVAGKFWRDKERVEFEQRIQQPDLAVALGGTSDPAARYCGFVSGEQKKRLFDQCDCLCFPTYYSTESFGIVLIEAMAHGMQIVTTRWRTIPELFPEGFAGLVEPRSPAQIADALLSCLSQDYDGTLREHFLSKFTRERFTENIKAALLQG